MPNIHFALGTEFAKYFVFEDPNWTYANFDFAGWRERTAAQAQLLNATNTDLRRFRARGGKLIMWHGWSDAALPAARTLEYYEAVVKQEPGAESFVKLYMMPGVGHCRGGAGPDRADWIATLEAWVERGTAPGDIIATKVNQQGAVTLERPLCPYPQVAQYNGTGNVNVAASFRCVPPSR
jgi:feruloyl esterase